MKIKIKKKLRMNINKKMRTNINKKMRMNIIIKNLRARQNENGSQ